MIFSAKCCSLEALKIIVVGHDNQIKSNKMMSMMKKRAEAARRKRIDHVFVKADDNSNGKITPQQMIKLFTANGEVNTLSLYFGSS